MSLIGPRPLLVQYLPLYSEEQRHRHEAGNTVWEFMIDDSYKKKQHVIAVNERKE